MRSTEGAPERRYDVFLCHNQQDKSVVRDIADALQIDAGVLFFLDENAIPASVEFFPFIEAEMRRAASCAILLGPLGWGPTHLQEAELALRIKAQNKDFRIIPVALPGCPDTAWGELFGKGRTPNYNWVKFNTVTDEAARARLLEAIQGDFTVRAAGPEAVTPYYVRRQATLWDQSNRRDDSLLLRGELLRAAQREAAANPSLVTPLAIPFLVQCAETERKTYRRRVGLAMTAAAVTTVLSVVALMQRQEARRAASIALARSLAAAAPRTIGPDRNDELAILLARQAYLVDQGQGGPSASLTGAALSEVLGTPFISSALRLPEGASALDVSPTGRFVLATGEAWTVVGPVHDEAGTPLRGTAEVATLGGVTCAVFDPIEDMLWIATPQGLLVRRDPHSPAGGGRAVADLGGVARSLSMAADGSVAVALVGDATLIAVDLRSGVPRRWNLRSKIRSVETSPRGERIAVSYEDDRQRLDIFDVGLSVPRRSVRTRDSVNAFAFDPGNETIVVGERDGRTWRWGLRGELVDMASDWAGSIDVVAVSADGRIAVAASGAITPGIQVWDASAGDARTVIQGPRGTSMLRLTRDNRFVVSAGLGGEVRYWRVAGSGARRSARADDHQLLRLSGRLYAVARDPRSDSFVVGGDHGVLQAWASPALERAPKVLADARAAALSAVPNPDPGSGGWRSGLTTSHVMGVAMSGDGRRFATVDPYGYAVVFDADAPERAPALVDTQSTGKPAFSVALDRSGRQLAVGATATFTVVHTLGDDRLSMLSTPLPNPGNATVRALVFQDDLYLLVGNDDGRLTRWTLGDRPYGADLIADGDAIWAVNTLHDGRIAVARGDRIDMVWPAASGVGLTNLSKGLGRPTSLAVSDDQHLLAAGFTDGAVRIWSLATPSRAPLTLRPHRDYVRSLVFDSAGQTLVSVGDDGSIQSSVVGGQRLAEIACGLVRRDLTADEVREYFGEFPAVLPTCPEPGRVVYGRGLRGAGASMEVHN